MATIGSCNEYSFVYPNSKTFLCYFCVDYYWQLERICNLFMVCLLKKKKSLISERNSYLVSTNAMQCPKRAK